ncbi:MAG: DNA methyltransferase [Methanobacteriaceae archaeon]
MKSFKESIGQISPDHDYPAGLIHPYWARKPLNIIESIVCHYSKEGDTVADPFMGSGTSIIAAIKNNRNAVGSDLSPISKLLVESILNSAKSPSKYRKILIDAVENWTNFAIDLYKTNDDRCVERETFFVEGEYINSQFSLTLENAKIKSIKNKEIKGKPEIVNIVEYQNALDSYFVNNPIDFSKIDFIENTRIAVHNGVKASDFFTERNIVFINHAQMYIEKNLTCNKEIDFLKLFLSSMIPML